MLVREKRIHKKILNTNMGGNDQEEDLKPDG